ncbi:MAG: hypothetical protein AABY22_06700 [Nanoarchaeota archaeon]
MNDKVMISHGKITHFLAKRLDCMSCIKVELWYLRQIQKAGGQTKFLENLSGRKKK